MSMIHIENLTKAYGGNVILENINLDVEQGELGKIRGSVDDTGGIDQIAVKERCVVHLVRASFLVVGKLWFSFFYCTQSCDKVNIVQVNSNILHSKGTFGWI